MSEGREDKGIEEAVTAWGRSIVGAPRNLKDLVVNVTDRDEVVERVYTEIVRREIVRSTSTTQQRTATSPRISAESVDLFAHTPESLRAASEHALVCDKCMSAGSHRCTVCLGTSETNCYTCHGSGKETKYFKNGNSRLIKCKACGTKGRVRCRECSGGKTTCGDCKGSGHYLAWLSFKETKVVNVLVEPDGPILAAHSYLREPRRLDTSAVKTLTVEEMVDAPGALAPTAVTAGWNLIEPRQRIADAKRERVTAVQYVRLAVVRRDVEFETCGKRATLVLSGTDLFPSSTPEALAPIIRRRRLWLFGTAALAAGVWGLRFTQTHDSAYFGNVNVATAVVAGFASLCALLWLGALLRAWRPGFRSHGLSWGHRITGALIAPAIAALVVLPMISAPSVKDVDAALAAGDSARARDVVDAVKQAKGLTTEIRDADDRVTLAEASHQPLEARLQLLDTVASHNGSESAAATASARAERLQLLRQMIAAHKPEEALVAIDKWYPSTSDPQVREEQARAFEATEVRCDDPLCKYESAAKAAMSHENPTRSARATELKDQLAGALAIPSKPAPDQQTRAHEARTLSVLAAKTAASQTARDLATRAQEAHLWAAADLSKIPLLGASIATTNEILGTPTKQDANVVQHHFADADIFLVVDAKGACRGVYAIGGPTTNGGPRRLQSKEWPTDRILSQSLGRPAVMRAGTRATTSWYEGGTAIVARYRSVDLVELRVADVTP